MTDVNRTIVIPAADVAAARTSVEMIPGGAGMFTSPVTLDPAGAPAEDGFVSSGPMPEEVLSVMWSSATIGDLATETAQQTIERAGYHQIRWPD
jgi:hypothetical protein